MSPTRRHEGFMKGEALRLLSKNSSQTAFEENISNFAAGLKIEVTQQQQK